MDRLGTISLFSSFAIAMVITIWAIYLDSFFHNAAYVGFFAAFLTITGIISYIFLTPIVERGNKANLYALTILIYMISYLLFAFFPNIYVIIALGILISIIGSLRITLFGIIIRDKTKDCSVAKTEGLIYTLSNLSWLVAPVIAGFIASKYGIKEVFILSAMVLLITSILFRFFKIKDNRKTKVDKNLLTPIKEFFQDKKRIYAYFIGGGIDFWWSLIYIYIPIYIFELGLNEKIIGYFLGAVVIPLVLTEYYFGKKAGKKGFKKLFIIGYSVLGIAAISAFFISNIYLILLILILASFGAGMLEPTTEAYFFDVITPKQRDKFYGPYNTTADLNAFLGRALPAVILLIFPFRAIFIFFGVAMLIFAFISSRAKEVIEKK